MSNTTSISAPVPTSSSSTTAHSHATLANLTAIIDSKTATVREQQVATGQRIAREFQAYGYLSARANVSGDPRAYLKAYLTYYDSLSPEEQQTARYRGTREGALKGLADTASLAQNAPSAQAPLPEIPTIGSTSDGTASIFPSTNLLSGLRSLLGIIEKARHPGPIAIKPISNFDFKA